MSPTSVDHSTGLVGPGAPAPTDLPMASGPTTKPALFGPPMFTAVALPHLVKAAPSPIFCASSENARSASARLLTGGSP